MNEPRDITADEVREIVKSNGVTWIEAHNCSICGVAVGWEVYGDAVSFQSNCGCTRHYEPPRQSSFEAVLGSKRTNRQNTFWFGDKTPQPGGFLFGLWGWQKRQYKRSIGLWIVSAIGTIRDLSFGSMAVQL